MKTDGKKTMKTVLVVDDMAVFRDPIAASLGLAGFKTVKAADGLQGLDALREHRPDLVLLDLSMPNLDGLSVLRAIRRDPVSGQVPVIMLTALTDKKFIIDAAKLGVRDYLLKSRFSLTELAERVRSALAAEPGVAQSCPAETATEPPLVAGRC
jgi:two-component system phosphate regulon response regulator PhoB